LTTGLLLLNHHWVILLPILGLQSCVKEGIERSAPTIDREFLFVDILENKVKSTAEWKHFCCGAVLFEKN
jgi:hypothetical protein